MSPQDDNCPFMLSNLTFEHFSNFAMQRKACGERPRSLDVPWQCILRAVAECSQASLHMSKYAMQTNFFDNRKQFTKGIRWHIAIKKVLEGDVTMVGKKKMGFNV